MSVHLALDHHGDHEHDLADLAHAGLHGHHHHAEAAPDHHHHAIAVEVSPVLQRSFTPAAWLSPLVASETSPAARPTPDRPPERGSPTSLFTTHCSLLL